MRFYLILFFCAGLFFTSCKDKKGIPDDVIPEHKMAELLTDIHIIDGSLFDVPQSPDSLTKHGLGLYLGLFKAYHVDTLLFKKSLAYYTARPEILTEIYSGVTRRLQNKIDSLQKVKPKVTPDSLKKQRIRQTADSLANAKKLHNIDSVKKVRALIRLDSIQKAGFKRKFQLHRAKPL